MKPAVLLQLGGSAFQAPLIVTARSMGLRVVVCDQNAQCAGRRLSDEYVRASTVDVSAIVDVARRFRASGISAYASDPASYTAAVAAEQLGLPTNPSAVVRTFTRKDLFRAFLNRHGFATPRYATCANREEFIQAIETVGLPCMVKPVDASGSRGVAEVATTGAAEEAFASAMNCSRQGLMIVEATISRKLVQVAGDAFIQDGRLAFHCFGQENFDRAVNPLAPVAETFPLSIGAGPERQIEQELRRFVSLSGLRAGAINFDIVIDDTDRVNLIDVGPRSGGNGIPETIRLHTGCDTIRWSIMAALGERVDRSEFEKRTDNADCHATYVVHSRRSGTLRGFRIADSVRDNILKLHLCTDRIASSVRKFTDSGDTLGYALLRFRCEGEMMSILPTLPDLIAPDVVDAA